MGSCRRTCGTTTRCVSTQRCTTAHHLPSSGKWPSHQVSTEVVQDPKRTTEARCARYYWTRLQVSFGVRQPPSIFMRVTLDTNLVDDHRIAALARRLGWDTCVVSVTRRETEGTSFHSDASNHPAVSEVAVWGESRWGVGTWSDHSVGDCLDHALGIISGGSFPKAGNRDNLTPGQRNQLRDAMILCTHVREQRDLFITDDRKAFVTAGRREAFQRAFNARILTSAECLSEFDAPVA